MGASPFILAYGGGVVGGVKEDRERRRRKKGERLETRKNKWERSLRVRRRKRNKVQPKRWIPFDAESKR